MYLDIHLSKKIIFIPYWLSAGQKTIILTTFFVRNCNLRYLGKQQEEDFSSIQYLGMVLRLSLIAVLQGLSSERVETATIHTPAEGGGGWERGEGHLFSFYFKSNQVHF